MTRLHAPDFPEEPIRARARNGVASAFPPGAEYGRTVFGAAPVTGTSIQPDPLDCGCLAPPIFMPQRLEKLIELGREPTHADVVLDTVIGGLRSPFPIFLSALGSTEVASTSLGLSTVRQSARLGLPMVVGENVVSVNGYRQSDSDTATTLLSRIGAYVSELRGDHGGVVVQQNTEDADSEVWNLVYSDPSVQDLLGSGRMAFELKTGQGAKPGLGGMTMLDVADAVRLADRYVIDVVHGTGLLRSSSPGTFTEEILRQQIRLMRNNYPRARVWVKLPPVRDVRHAALTAWSAGADAVTVDGAEAGTGWAPVSLLQHVGLPLGECLLRLGPQSSCLLVSGRMWEGVRAVKCLAMGATAIGLGRAALLAVDEAPGNGLANLVECMAFEMRLLISALGKYAPGRLGLEDLWPGTAMEDVAATGIGDRVGQP